jgi:hypothetical protein
VAGIAPAKFTPRQFKLTPAPLASSAARAGVKGALGMIPEAGTALASLVDVLWKKNDTSQSDVFDQMKAYVDNLVGDQLAREHIDLLDQHIKGLQEGLEEYDDLDSGLEKGTKLAALLLDLAPIEHEYFDDKRKPEQVLAQFLGLGLVKLKALQEQAIHDTEFYGAKPCNHALHVKKHNDAVKKYQAAVKNLQDRLVAWRLSYIGPGYGTKDCHFGAKFTRHCDTVYYVKDKYCDLQLEVSVNEPSKLNPAIERRKAALEKAYREDLDSLLQPIIAWQELDPGPAGPTAACHWNARMGAK